MMAKRSRPRQPTRVEHWLRPAQQMAIVPQVKVEVKPVEAEFSADDMWTLKNELREALKQKDYATQQPRYKVLIEKLIDGALHGNNKNYMQLILSYIEGKPIQSVEHSGAVASLNVELNNDQFDQLIRERTAQLDSGKSGETTAD